jgi:hypothetical protein
MESGSAGPISSNTEATREQDAFEPEHVGGPVTTSTFERLTELQPGSTVDSRRFRMNIILNTAGSGFVENDWVGRSLQIGDDVRLAVTLPDPRCVMPSSRSPDSRVTARFSRTSPSTTGSRSLAAACTRAPACTPSVGPAAPSGRRRGQPDLARSLRGISGSRPSAGMDENQQRAQTPAAAAFRVVG